MKLCEGSTAIDFTVEDTNGRLISLRDFRGKKLMLSFYRFTECIYSNLRLRQVSERFPEFQGKGLEKIAFFQSSTDQIKKNSINPPFPLVSDSKRKIFKAYRVEEDSLLGYIKGYFRIPRALKAMTYGFIPRSGQGNKTLLPAEFLISEDGKIVKSHYGKDISDYLPLTAVEEFLNAPKKSFPHTDFSFFGKR